MQDKASGKWLKFYVEKKMPAKDIPIDDTIREEVRRALAADRGSKAIDLNLRVANELLKSKVVVEDTTLAKQWTDEVDSLRAAMKTREAAAASTPSTGGTTAGAPTTPPVTTAPTGKPK
jgi:hypothetical protein